MSEFERLGTWLTPLLQRLSPAARSSLTRKISIELRMRTQARIKAQTDVEGAAFIPRKPSKHKNGQPMFRELSKVRWLRMQSTATTASVGYSGGAAKVARVHQEGLTDTIRKGSSKRYAYPRRQLLGFSSQDEKWIETMILDSLDH